MAKHGLGRRHSPDDRDRAYLMARRLAPAGTPLPTRKTWGIAATALDQGSTGTCVGQSCLNFLRADPIRTMAKSAPTAYELYEAATKIDQWPENDNDIRMEWGTSVRAGMQVLMSLGRLKSYLWAFDLQTALEFVLTHGPCVIGVNWYSSFYTPNAEGIISIKPNARIDGGHAILWRGADTKRGLARLSNSWGDDWGLSGDCLISFRDLERLIHEDGECATAIEQKVKAKAL